MNDSNRPLRVILFGATGTIGQATLKALLEAGHVVTCFLRPTSNVDLPAGATACFGNVAQPSHAFEETAFDAVVSCMASRTGMPRDAWAIDHDAHAAVLAEAKASGVRRFVLLSALCVQQPELPFQKAKLAFEAKLQDSGMTYSIVRPTAFFKSLSGQVKRVQEGKPFLVFGDGRLTACKPISDRDLGRYIAGCLTDPNRSNRILPIGGPGHSITPHEQGEALFAMLGRRPTFRRVPIAMMDAIIAALTVVGWVSPKARDKADLARIGRYYATHSMLVWDQAAGKYSDSSTPETGSESLYDFYEALLRGEAKIDLGDHAVF
ncbi:MAG: NAD(P)H-binding protein [Pseudomonadota bacterium]